MVGMSFHELDYVSHVGELFAASRGTVESLHGRDIRWREHILKEAFGMNRVPFTVTTMVQGIPPIASSLSCSKILQAMLRGDAQSDITHSLNTKDRVIIGKAPFQHCPGYFSVWDEIKEHPRCKIIYIRRDNPLTLLVSSSNSFLQRQWQVLENEEPKVGQVHLGVRYVAEFIAFYEAQTAFFDVYFDNCAPDKVLVIDFEDLVGDWETCVDKICRFIRVEKQGVERKTYQQIQDGSHLSLISNLGELLSYFKNTRWEEYFRI